MILVKLIWMEISIIYNRQKLDSFKQINIITWNTTNNNNTFIELYFEVKAIQIRTSLWSYVLQDI